jgi:hypothetical protein
LYWSREPLSPRLLPLPAAFVAVPLIVDRSYLNHCYYCSFSFGAYLLPVSGTIRTTMQR